MPKKEEYCCHFHSIVIVLAMCLMIFVLGNTVIQLNYYTEYNYMDYT